MSGVRGLVRFTLGGAIDAGLLRGYEVGQTVREEHIHWVEDAMRERATKLRDEPTKGISDVPLDNEGSGISHEVMEAIKPTLAEVVQEQDMGAHITVIVTGEDGHVSLASTEATAEFLEAAIMEALGAIRRIRRLT